MVAVAAATSKYLANKPTGWSFGLLIVALVLFVLATIDATIPPRARQAWPALIAAGLAFFVLAFFVS